MTGLDVTTDGPLGFALLAASPVAALAAAWWTWRSAGIRDVLTRVAIAALRGLFVGLALALLADPAIMRTVERLPRLVVRWGDEAALDIADAPAGETRRAALQSSLDRARSLGLDDRFEIVDSSEAASDADGSAAVLLLAPDEASVAAAGRDGRVFALLPPRDGSVPDCSILSVDAPVRAAAGAPVEFVATVRCRGSAGRRVVVTLSDGTRVVRSAARDVAGPDETFTVAFGAALQSVGWQKVTVEAAGLTGEVSLADNRLDRWIDLESEARSVLIIESAPTWEGKFVRRALEKDPTLRVDYATAVSREAVVDVQTSTGDGSVPKPDRSIAGPASLQAVLGDEKRLFSYDAIVAGPLDGAAIGDAAAVRLARFVDAKGGGLVVLGGNAYAGSVLALRGKFAQLIPAVIPARSLGRADSSAAKVEGAAVLEPAEGFTGHPAFSMLGDDPAAVLKKLPKLGGGYLRMGELAPGAETIAVDGSSHAGTPLVVAQRFGAGRVTLVAPPDTWRLSVGATQEFEDVAAKFWTGLVGWTAAGARDTVRMWAEPTDAGQASAAHFVMELRTSDFSPRTAARVEAVAELEGDAGAAPVSVRFVADASEPGRYVGTAVLPVPGTWLATATIDGRDHGTARVEVRATSEAIARPDPSTQGALEIALREGGGALVRDGNAEALVEAAGAPARAAVAISTRPARGVWWAYVLPLIFAGEAFLRRRAGLDAEESAPGAIATGS